MIAIRRDGRWTVVFSIIEEWTAWLLLRERERELARQDLIRQAEQARIMAQRTALATQRERVAPDRERPERHRRAA